MLILRGLSTFRAATPKQTNAETDKRRNRQTPKQTKASAPVPTSATFATDHRTVRETSGCRPRLTAAVVARRASKPSRNSPQSCFSRADDPGAGDRVAGRLVRARNHRRWEFAVLKSGACGSAMPSHRLLCSHPQIADRPRGDGPMRKMVVPVAVVLALFAAGCSGNAPNTSPTGSSPGMGPSRRLPPPAAASSTPPGGPAPAQSGTAPAPSVAAPAPSVAAPPASVTRSTPATVAAGPTPSGATTTTSAPTAAAAPTTRAAPTTNPAPRAPFDFSGTCEGMPVCPTANGAAGAATNPGPAAVTDFSGTCEGMPVCPPANGGAGAAPANGGAGAANNLGPVADTNFSGTCEGQEFCPPGR
jgi:hypothetical protein